MNNNFFPPLLLGEEMGERLKFLLISKILIVGKCL